MPDAKWRMPQQDEYFSIFLLYEDGEVINAFTNSVQAEALVRVLREADEERGERYNYHIRSMYTEPHDNNV